MNPEAVEKFDEYVESLPSLAAELILDDPELLAMMQQDSYWAPQPISIRPYAAVTLPLSSYASGKYFTYNGKVCACHANCTYTLPIGSTATTR